MRAIGMLRGAWEFREFIKASVHRELVTKYLGTQLGLFWIVAQPLALIAIYTLVFAEIMKPVMPGHASRFAYSIYLTSGIIVWAFFAELTSRLVGVFVSSAHLLKKVSVPKVTLPIIGLAIALLNLGIILVLFLAFLAVTGQWPGLPLLALPVIVVIAAAFGTGLGVLLGTINVFYRDVEQSVALVLNFWFWLTPIVYPIRGLPEGWQGVLAWNPMAPLVRATQTIFLDRQFPDWTTLVYPSALALALLMLGLITFWRLSPEMVDEL